MTLEEKPGGRLEDAFAALAAGQPDRAAQLAEVAAGERPGWSVPWHLLGLCARARGASPETVGTLMERALVREPVSVEMRLDAAEAALLLKRTARAEQLAVAAARERPASSLPWQLQARCARLRGRAPEVAAALMEQAVAYGPVPADVRLECAVAALAAGHTERAEALAQAVSLEQPEWGVPWHILGTCARKRGAPAETVADLLDRALRLTGTTAEMKVDGGFAALTLGQLARAEQLAAEAAGERPDWSAPWHLRALCVRAAEGDPALTAEYMDQALRRAPVTPEMRYDGGLAAVCAGQTARAERLAIEASNERPAWSLPWQLLARCARARGRSPETVLAFMERALACQPVPAEMRLEGGFAALAAGQLDRAEYLAEAAAGERPAWSAPWHLLGLCARSRRASLEVVDAHLARALARRPVTTELLFDGALTARDLGRLDAARDLAARAVDQAPRWTDAVALLAALRDENAVLASSACTDAHR